MNRPFRALLLLGLLCLSSLAQAFDLQQLSDQLAKPAVVQGSFIQEKHLRALPQPLLSKGRFVLARDFGLLWLLETPLKQDYRINASGISRRESVGDVSTWKPVPNKNAGAEQNRLNTCCSSIERGVSVSCQAFASPLSCNKCSNRSTSMAADWSSVSSCWKPKATVPS